MSVLDFDEAAVNRPCGEVVGQNGKVGHVGRGLDGRGPLRIEGAINAERVDVSDIFEVITSLFAIWSAKSVSSSTVYSGDSASPGTWYSDHRFVTLE